jgi:hypothetical protein
MSDRSPHTRPEFVVTAPKTTNEGAWEGFATQGSYATNNVENPAENPTAAMRSHRKPARFKVPAWRGSNSVRAAGLVIAAVVGVAAIVYFVMPSSHSDRSNANGGTATGGQIGGKDLTQVTAQSGSVLMAHAGSQYPEMLQYCNALTTSVQTAEADSPIPDNAMQKMYAKSLTAFKMGAADCVAGITQHPEGVEDTVTSVNHAEINKAVSELSLGMNDLYIATEVLRKS